MSRSEFGRILRELRERPSQVRQHLVPFPVGSGQQLVQAEKTKTEGANIIIKQIAKQEVGARKRRKRRANAGNKTSMKNKRAEYSKLKKAVAKRLREENKALLTEEVKRVKALPAKERVAARKKARGNSKARLKAALAKLPAVSKKTFEQLEKFIASAKKLSL